MSFKTLWYGGSKSLAGKAGLKPQAGTIYRKQARLELMVRLENAGLGEAAIAAMTCVSLPRLRTIKKSPEYMSARIQITLGIITDVDSKMEQIKQQRKEILTHMLPPALLVIANELQAPAHSLGERKHKVALAQDLLDREGTFAKVSRTEVKPVDTFDFEHADAQSRSILSAIKSVAPAPAVKPPPTDETIKTLEGARKSASLEAAAAQTHSAEAVEANEAFSNSHTLSQTDQEEALARLEEEARSSGAEALLAQKSATEEIQ